MDPASLRPTICLQCGYARTGLPASSPCPECGAAPLPEGCLVVVARSDLGSSTSSLVAGGLLLAIAGGVIVNALARGAWNVHVTIAWLAVWGGFMLWSGVRRRRAERLRGGDVTWVLRPDSLEVQAQSGTARYRWDRFRRCDERRSLSRGWTRLRMVPRFMSTAHVIECWLPTATAAVAVVELRKRLAASLR